MKLLLTNQSAEALDVFDEDVCEIIRNMTLEKLTHLLRWHHQQFWRMGIPLATFFQLRDGVLRLVHVDRLDNCLPAHQRFRALLFGKETNGVEGRQLVQALDGFLFAEDIFGGESNEDEGQLTSAQSLAIVGGRL